MSKQGLFIRRVNTLLPIYFQAPFGGGGGFNPGLGFQVNPGGFQAPNLNPFQGPVGNFPFQQAAQFQQPGLNQFNQYGGFGNSHGAGLPVPQPVPAQKVIVCP